MKKKAGNLVIGIIFLAGLSLLLYPFVANQWNNYRQKQLISGYEQVVSDKEAAEGIDYDALGSPRCAKITACVFAPPTGRELPSR